jgi:hypothetical protein
LRQSHVRIEKLKIVRLPPSCKGSEKGRYRQQNMFSKKHKEMHSDAYFLV